LAALVDLAIGALLIVLSGFMFGEGGLWLEVAVLAAVIACVVTPATGFMLNAAGKQAYAQAAAWLPLAVALVVLAIPALARF
jgi:hypothetical protein